MAPRPGSLELETVAHAAGELRLQPMVPGGSLLHEANDAGAAKTRIRPGREIARFGVDLIVRGGQASMRTETAPLKNTGRYSVRCGLHLPIKPLLNGKVDSASPYVTNFKGVLVGKNVLNTKTPRFRVGQLLVGM